MIFFVHTYFVEVLVMYKLSSEEIDMVTRVQSLNEAVYISHCANTLGKDMCPAVLS